MVKPILHIPHSSAFLPDMEGYLLPKEELEKEIGLLTDWYTDELFVFDDAITIKAEFSRIYCDVERFADDEQEIMAKYGMGVIYEKTDDGRDMRKISPEKRKEILENYYWKHHQKLENAVNSQLQQEGKALIIDCHSFPDKPFIRDLNQVTNRPDINIGFDDFHTRKELLDLTTRYFTEKGLSIGFNWPYSGTLVPLNYYRKNSNVQSFMIEINRKLYLKADTYTRNNNYCYIKDVLFELSYIL